MPYERFVEIGRVAYVAHGDDKGKLIAIVDVIDHNRALVDGPCSGVNRKDMNFKALHLTQFKIKIGPSARTGTVRKAWEKAEIDQKWSETTWAKKLANVEKRANLTDFDRFKLMKAKQSRNRLINIEFGKLRKAARKQPAKPKRMRKRK
ncbi:60S ribosomal protein L14-like [Elysia marginata]|uniref:Large ribosomal subunit protein eL14 n=1 Tax=Elysia marginata TaxID=1093978 RepID=A0AAV4JCD4_9GAST|nr:60S ribosomal protein L14-like [Elysia marginata]